MLRRKRRMPFDPPGSNKRRKKPQAPRRTDQIFLSRRMFLVKAGIAAGFTTLAVRLGYMQIVRGETYTEAAAEQRRPLERAQTDPRHRSSTAPGGRWPRTAGPGRSGSSRPTCRSSTARNGRMCASN